MNLLELIFWLSLGILFYSYIGYGVILLIILKIQKFFSFSKKVKIAQDSTFEPAVTLLVAAYNEKDCLHEKLQNSFQLDYPKDKLKIVFVN